MKLGFSGLFLIIQIIIVQYHMYPLTASLDIDVGSTDEQLVQYLVGRRLGDPIPSNVITEVSPFNIEPWNSPENVWYLYNPEDIRSDIREKGIKVTQEGYWQLMVQGQEILSGDITTGRKTVRRFYKGKGPLGDETNWFMHEYQAEPIAVKVLCHKQDFNSLCRVFLENNGILDCEGQPNAGAFDDVDGDNVEAMLLQFLGGEESGYRSLESTKNSEEVCGSEHRQLETTATSPCPLVTNNNNVQEGSDVLDDYMELNDLYSIATSSSSSDNSSIASLDSDEYFDADALVTDLQNNNCARNTDDGHTRLRSNVKAPAKSDEIVTRPPAQGSIHHIINNNFMAEEGVLSSTDSGNGAVPSAKASQDASISRTFPASQPKQTLSGSSKGSGSNTRICENVSSSKPSKGSAPKRTHSGSSEGSGSSRGSGSWPSRRVSSLKKRYCCFGYPEADS